MERRGSAPAPTAQDREQRGTVTPSATPGVTPRGKRGPGPRLAGRAHAWRGVAADQPLAVPLPRDALRDLESEMAQRGAAGQFNP